MKTLAKLVLFVIIAALALTALTACNILGDEKIVYHDIDEGKSLYRYTGVSTVSELRIPDEIDGVPVVELQKYSLSSAEYLKKIFIGKNVKIIDSWAITNCPLLESVELDPENEHFETEGGILYTKGKTKLLLYPTSKQKNAELKLPETVVEIGEAAFYLSTNIVKVEFNEGLKKIGSYAFLKCKNLQNFVLPQSLESIGADSFSYCDSLTELDIPYNVTEIGDYAFFSLSSKLTEIVIHRPIAEINAGKDWLPNKAGGVQQKVPVREI